MVECSIGCKGRAYSPNEVNDCRNKVTNHCLFKSNFCTQKSPKKIMISPVLQTDLTMRNSETRHCHDWIAAAAISLQSLYQGFGSRKSGLHKHGQKRRGGDRRGTRENSLFQSGILDVSRREKEERRRNGPAPHSHLRIPAPTHLNQQELQRCVLKGKSVIISFSEETRKERKMKTLLILKF